MRKVLAPLGQYDPQRLVNAATLPELTARAGELDAFAGREVVVYCHHGIRSANAAASAAS